MKKALFLTGLFFLLLSISSNFQCSKLLSGVTSLLITDSQEVAMGFNLNKQIIADTKQYPLLDTITNPKNKSLTRYIDSIGRAIAKNQTARPENSYLKYHFSVIKSDTTINAFAIPGGYVYIYTGLIIKARNEAEIAGVIAHEIAHITQKHGVETIIKAEGISYIEKLIFGDSSILAGITNSLLFMKFSRENEYEADSCSVEFLIKTGYNPDGMKTFLELLAANSGWRFEPLSTHPDTEKRVNAVAGLIAKKDPSVIANLKTPDKKVLYP